MLTTPEKDLLDFLDSTIEIYITDFISYYNGNMSLNELEAKHPCSGLMTDTCIALLKKLNYEVK